MMAAEASLSRSFALLMNWSTPALSNHTWQICAMESKVFNKRPGPLIKGLLKKNRGVTAFNNLHELKENRTVFAHRERGKILWSLICTHRGESKWMAIQTSICTHKYTLLLTCSVKGAFSLLTPGHLILKPGV